MTSLRAFLAALLTAAFLLGGAGVASADEVAVTKPTYDVVGSAHRVASKHRQVVVWFAARPTPTGYVEGEPVTWKIKEVGSAFVVTYVWQQRAGESFRWVAHFGRGPHALTVWRNGVLVRAYTIGHRASA